MAKKRVTGAKISDVQQAEGAVAEYAKLCLRLADMDVKAGEEAVALKEKYETLRGPVEARKAELEAGLKGFSLLNRTEVFGTKQSVSLAFGKLEFQKSTETQQMNGIKAEATLQKLKELGFKEAISVKESINTKVMQDWTDERLALVGRRRVQKEVFRVVPHEDVSA